MNVFETTLKAIDSYHHLALDPATRSIIISDEACISFLVYVLDNLNHEIVKKSLQTLLLLSENPGHRIILKNCFGMMYALDKIRKQNDLEDQIRELATTIYQRLNLPLQDNHNINREIPKKYTKRRLSHSIFEDGTSYKAKTVILEIEGLITKDHKQQCQEQLLKVKGVISITFDSPKRRCILRTKPNVTPEILVLAINATQYMSAQQVVKNDFGQEKLVSFGGISSGSNKENFPEYLPEEESPIKTIGESAIIEQNSVKSTKKGWFTAATDFLSKSFYW